MKKILFLIAILFSLNVSAQEKDQLFSLRKAIGKALRIETNKNNCQVYIGYLIFNTDKTGNIIGSNFELASDSLNTVQFQIIDNYLQSKKINLPFSKDGTYQLSENLSLKEIHEFAIRKKAFNTKIKLPIVIYKNSNRNNNDNCEALVNLNELRYLVTHLDMVNKKEFMFSPITISVAAAIQ